jgi:hypothetical protein
VQPGTGAIGGAGTETGTGAGTGVQPGQTGTTGDLQTGVNGIRGTATPGVAGGTTGTAITSPADLALTQRIRAELLRGGMGTGVGNPSVATPRGVGTIPPQSLANVQITADRGAITLQGTVNNEVERRLIENRVRRVTGVNTIVNNLAVAPRGQTLPGQGAGRNVGTGLGTTTPGTAPGVGQGQNGTGTVTPAPR